MVNNGVRVNAQAGGGCSSWEMMGEEEDSCPCSVEAAMPRPHEQKYHFFVLPV